MLIGFQRWQDRAAIAVVDRDASVLVVWRHSSSAFSNLARLVCLTQVWICMENPTIGSPGDNFHAQFGICSLVSIS